MREIKSGAEHATRVFCMDEQTEHGLCRDYIIRENTEKPFQDLVHVHFQEGLAEEVGVNGCCVEDLIAICLDRLFTTKTRKHSSVGVSIAVTKLEDAMLALNAITE